MLAHERDFKERRFMPDSGPLPTVGTILSHEVRYRSSGPGGTPMRSSVGRTRVIAAVLLLAYLPRAPVGGSRTSPRKHSSKPSIQRRSASRDPTARSRSCTSRPSPATPGAAPFKSLRSRSTTCRLSRPATETRASRSCRRRDLHRRDGRRGDHLLGERLPGPRFRRVLGKYCRDAYGPVRA
jgi:hypothetical protein